ncbi:MAG: TIGR02466 family protein [Pseudomonadota bacterium]
MPTQPKQVRKSQIHGLFPSPVMQVPGALGNPLLGQIVSRIESEAREINVASAQLSHTEMVSAEGDPLYAQAASRLAPRVVEFGTLLFGEDLTWQVKEIWVNVLETGGAQGIHNHANSFISGIVYLTTPPPGTGTVFHKALGGSEYSFVNQNKTTRMGPFNASRWQVPQMQAGDMVLFPSYMLHEVPKNEGARRISMAFNALPERIDSWGYQVRFS